MKEFNKKNPNVVKLEPKPIKAEGNILDLKGKGLKRDQRLDSRFAPPLKLQATRGRGNDRGEKKKDLRDPTLTDGHPLGWLQHSAQDDRIKTTRDSGSEAGITNGISWQAEEGNKNGKMSLAAKLIIFVLLLTAAGGFIVKSPIMVLTFLLFVIVFYVFLKKGKDTISVVINAQGIKISNTMYLYENVKSFWVFYDPPHEKYLSIATRSFLTPFVRVKLDSQNPVELRKFLVSYLVEEEHPAPFLEVMIEKLGI